MKVSIVALGVVLAVCSLINVGEGSSGVKDYGDSCNIVASGIQFIAALGESKNQYQGACDVSKGLVCAINQCTCLVGEYKQNLVEQIFGGGSCSGVAKTSAGAAIILSFIPLIYYFRN